MTSNVFLKTREKSGIIIYVMRPVSLRQVVTILSVSFLPLWKSNRLDVCIHCKCSKIDKSTQLFELFRWNTKTLFTFATALTEVLITVLQYS